MIFNFKKAEVQALLQSSEPKSMQIKTQTFEGAQVHIKGLSPYQKFGVGESLLGGGFFQMCLCVCVCVCVWWGGRGGREMRKFLAGGGRLTRRKFYCKGKSRLILRCLMLKQNLKRFIKEQNIHLMLELLYHKPNLLITTVVYGSIF